MPSAKCQVSRVECFAFNTPSPLINSFTINKLLLSTTYFGPVQWYSKLRHCMGSFVSIEAWETFQKQTYRNRCIIASPNGPQALSVPVVHSGNTCINELEISPHGNWRHLHWQALQTAYGESAFFDYYIDDLRPFFFDCGPESPYHLTKLLDYNMAATRLLCRLLDIDTELRLTESYTKDAEDDYRTAIRPKNPPHDNAFVAKPYYQVYRQRHGFIENLSILDLLFNEGPEAILYL